LPLLLILQFAVVAVGWFTNLSLYEVDKVPGPVAVLLDIVFYVSLFNKTITKI